MAERKRLAPAAADNGVSAALISHLLLFDVTSRNSGRTETMLRAVRPGDCVVTTMQGEARRLRDRLREMGQEGVEVAVIDPCENPMMRRGTQAKGAVIFDHLWIQGFWTHRIEQALGDFRTFQREMSKLDQPRPSEDVRGERYSDLIRGL